MDVGRRALFGMSDLECGCGICGFVGCGGCKSHKKARLNELRVLAYYES